MKCELKIWNVVKLVRFLKANLNPVVADVELNNFWWLQDSTMLEG